MSSSEPKDEITNSTIKNIEPVDRRYHDVIPHPNRRSTDVTWNKWINRVRDAGFLILGLAGTVNQLFYATPPNPVLYPILASLLGAPFALALDERRREKA